MLIKFILKKKTVTNHSEREDQDLMCSRAKDKNKIAGIYL